ncbi:peptidyl-prolyl cis-trans isomerase-like 4 [Ptychodera flava]|uniref:peptidyl-prolyl cis-trans isomerase-like 4 n=1 Tax=Ptychodera flava TaxID=63121 RepID=UPI00396A4C8B
MAVLLETTLGDIVVDLYTKERPRCCLNFLKLCKIKYYNYCIFHSVQRNFTVQTGDPTTSGRGGESVFSKLYGEQAKYFEVETTPRIKHRKLGAVSMVNNGSNGHGSQFMITTAENIDYLDGVHTVFGEVSEGIDVLMKINEAFVDKEHRPYQDIRVNHTVILDDPFDDPPGLEVPDRSPEPTKEQLDTGRIGADEEIDDTKGKSMEEIEEMVKAREAKARAQILEMVGDLPEADVKPPENVLFVCKLNAVTTSEDLETIFSRFGPIISCDVIRDQKTGDSLCYAFIEFEKEEDCEEAFFKMDNVLIDDRRIHVDFSQSVAKLKDKYNLGGGKKFNENKGPQFVVKDKSKRQDSYDLVFDDDDRPAKLTSDDKQSKHSHKSKKRKHKREDSEEREHKKSKEKHKSRSHRDGSGDEDSRHLKEQKRDKHRERDRKRHQEREADRQIDRDKERYRDRDRDSDRDRDRERDRIEIEIETEKETGIEIGTETGTGIETEIGEGKGVGTGTENTGTKGDS